MAEQIYLADADLERALRDVGQHVAYPETPDLALSVRVRLAAQVPPPARRRWLWLLEPGWRRAAAVALVALLVLVGAGLAISPEARDVVAERLGLKGVTIEHVPEVPTPQATATAEPTRAAGTASPTPPPPGAGLGLGERTSLLEARTQVVFSIQMPSALGAPDAVYRVSQNQVSLVYAPRPGLPANAQAASVGLLLTEFRATLDDTLFGKGVPPNARLEEVQVNGERAFFISGAPHTFFVRDPSGTVRDERSRLAGNTLLWSRRADGLTFRLESALGRDAAIAIAESLR
jgi:hypothetical protein